MTRLVDLANAISKRKTSYGQTTKNMKGADKSLAL
jgi:hypothetical protein